MKGEQNPMENVSIVITQAWAWFIAACAAVVTIVNAWKAMKDVKSASPNAKQNDILRIHEERLGLIEDRLSHGEERFQAIDSNNEVTQEALLALMSHAINGNDIDSLKEARDKLQHHLITRR